MNWHYQIIKTFPSHLILLCLLVLSFSASCNVGKPVVAYRKNIICIDQERDALLKFKHHIQSDYCGLLSSWGNPNKPDCCTWKGVSCSNQSGHVIGLHLSGASYHWGCLYSQVFSPSLSELKHLKYLDLSSNYFYDMVIPTSIGSLLNLIHLNLSGSSFGGNIPKQLGNLTHLTSFDLSCNYQLSAKSLNWLSRLCLLRDINLSGINLSGAMDWSQSIGSLVNLIHLNLSDSYISGNIPNQLVNLAHLTSLDLSYNYGLSAQSLNWLSLLSSLRDIDLSDTDLSEATDWTQSIGSLPMLEVLQMDNSQLSTSLTSSSSLSSANLRIVSLSGNNYISSSIFQWLFNSTSNYSSGVPSLEYLDLSNNSIQGPIPDVIGKLGSLMHVDLSSNALTGSIPSTLGVSGSLGGPSRLSYLALSNNQLEGTIPASIANLKYLGYLDLSNNNLSGDIPCKLEMRELPYYASFAYNNLSGSIPKHLSYLGPDPFQGNPNFRTDKIQGSCDKHDKFKLGLYVSIGLGFYTGFWAFCGTLTLKNSWRHAYFRFIDHVIDNIYVIVAVNLARFRRNSQV